MQKSCILICFVLKCAWLNNQNIFKKNILKKSDSSFFEEIDKTGNVQNILIIMFLGFPVVISLRLITRNET